MTTHWIRPLYLPSTQTQPRSTTLPLPSQNPPNGCSTLTSTWTICSAPLRGAPPRNRGSWSLRSTSSRKYPLPYQGRSRIRKSLRRGWPEMGNEKQPRRSSDGSSTKTRALFGCQQIARPSFYLSSTTPPHVATCQ